MNQYITWAVIKNLRKKYYLTQAELSDKLNVSDKTVPKWSIAHPAQYSSLPFALYCSFIWYKL